LESLVETSLHGLTALSPCQQIKIRVIREGRVSRQLATVFRASRTLGPHLLEHPFDVLLFGLLFRELEKRQIEDLQRAPATSRTGPNTTEKMNQVQALLDFLNLSLRTQARE
jgi:hypothetical protein